MFGGQPPAVRWTWLAPPRRLRLDPWTLGTLAVAAGIALPLLTVIRLAIAPTDDIWRHLVTTVLGHYALTTALLMAGVGAGTLAIGAGTAWLVTMCRFPGRRCFEAALLLPMAVPAYVIAYVYTDVLDYAGPVQKMLRAAFGWSSARDYWFPEIRSLGGAIAMMTLVLYPYVYLLSRAAFLEQSICVLEVGRTLGRGPWRSFFSIALPLARPAIAVGVTLALMETINDFGTVDYFAVATFTAGIYDVWTNMNSTAGAAQLATVLLAFVALLVGIERWGRRHQRVHHTSTKYRPLPGYRLQGARAAAAFAACLVPVVLGFAIPAGVLVRHSALYGGRSLTPAFATYAANSLTISTVTAVAAVGIGLFLAYGLRQSGNAWVRIASRFASTGYTVPGAVLAVGVLIPLAHLDNTIDALARQALGISTGLLLSGTTVAMAYGYLVRFLALSFGTVESGLARITPSMDGAARTLGRSAAGTLRSVHVPMMRGSVLTAAILVFVDCMKELPMTVLLRPFNYETLATYVHQLAQRELLEESALGALAIVAAGLLPVIALSYAIGRSRPGHRGAP